MFYLNLRLIRVQILHLCLDIHNTFSSKNNEGYELWLLS